MDLISILVYDRKDSELSPDEKFAKQVAKRKMLGNIKFIGMSQVFLIIDLKKFLLFETIPL